MKRIIVLIFLIFVFCITFSGCLNSEPSSEIITLETLEEKSEIIEKQVYEDILMYKTKKVEEYLYFLENLDESKYNILDISTSMYTGAYTSREFYIVTYEKLEEPREIKDTGKVLLFKTKHEEEYSRFLSNFDKDTFEIMGISTSMYTGAYTNRKFYIVTYREIIK